MSCKLGPVNHLLSKSPHLFASIIVFRLKLPENKGDTKKQRAYYRWHLYLKTLIFTGLPPSNVNIGLIEEKTRQILS